ncbi:MHC class II regulatory factor RFX1 [Tupaia chinensis]|uniref:MHC class II regulatory factor RFX1 n=1 Tax=Tupaia chinensis TaxID=246437 RepID=L8YDI4_TUPCH|nr:MHC class II regulatory factor RFX1 [Tupaia chinensis]
MRAQPQSQTSQKAALRHHIPSVTSTTDTRNWLTESRRSLKKEIFLSPLFNSSPQPQAPPQGSQKQYVSELPAAPTPSQPAAPTPPTASPQYIVVTVSEGAMRASETVSEASPGSTASQTGVPTQVVQQVQSTQQMAPRPAASTRLGLAGSEKQTGSGPPSHPAPQRLLVQTSVQAKPGHVSPLQLTSIQVPQQALPTQRLVVQSTAPGSKAGQVALTVHGTQQVHSPPERSPVQANSSASKTAGAPTGTVPQQLQVHSVQQSVPVTQERSVVQATPQAPKAGPVQQLTVQGLQPVHVAQEVQQLQQVPVPHVYSSQVQYVEGGDASYAASAIASQSYSHTTRASPATVQWLLDNYETAEGVSLPRSTLYCHYLLHCQEQKLEPVNAASFGKLIRSVFMGLRTRRLGTRGNSKYHYYGLRIKASSPLLRLMEDQQHMAMRGQPFSQKQRQVDNVVPHSIPCPGPPDASRSLPDFTELDLQGKLLPDGVGPGDIKAFQVLYREHCEAIVDVMVNLQFTLVETLWKTFWRYNLGQPSEAPPLAVHDEAEKRLPKASLVLLSKFEPVLQWTKHCDNVLYQGLVEILIPDVLRPIPSALTQAIRNFAKSLEGWLTHAMVNIPEEMLRVKVAAAGAFAQTLRRYTSLNHLAQAARAVLQNTAQINQMLSDLNRVDFANVQEQASWVCRCEDRVVQRLEQDFKVTLQQQNSLEQWAAWLDGVGSMVIRDLTLRSAASFGSFHLIRLLYDEYMYYLIEHRVAQAKGETPIAVMGEFANLATSLNPLDPDKGR